MVAINFTFPPAEYLIPADLKRTTIRRRNPVKEEQIKRIEVLELYWHQRQPDCKLLGTRRVRKLEIVNEPIIELIHSAPPQLIYGEGFGYDRSAMERFFTSHYDPFTLGEKNAFYIVEWYANTVEGIL
jgi:hypothetical protein